MGRVAAREMVLVMMTVKEKERSEVESWFSLVHASWTNRRIVAPLQKRLALCLAAAQGKCLLTHWTRVVSFGDTPLRATQS